MGLRFMRKHINLILKKNARTAGIYHQYLGGVAVVVKII